MLVDRLRSVDVRGVAGYAISNYVAFLGGLVLNIAFARGLSTAGRGDLALALHGSYLVATIVSGGLERTLGSVGPADDLRRSLGLASALIRHRVKIVVAGLVLVSVIVALSGRSDLVAVLSLVAVAGLGSAYVRCVKAASLASARSRVFALTNLGVQATILVSVLLVSTTGRATFVDFLLAFVAPYFAVIVCVEAVALRSRPERPAAIVFESFRRYGAGFLAAKLSMRADRILIPLFSSSEELGRYVVPAGLAEVMVFGVSAVSEGLIPSNVRSGIARRRLAPTLAVLLGISVIVSVAAYGLLRLAVGPVFGHAYDVSPALGIALAAGAGALVLSQMTGNLLASIHASGPVSRAEMLGAAIAMPGYVLLIPILGGVGAAVSATIAYLVMAICQLVALANARQAVIHLMEE